MGIVRDRHEEGPGTPGALVLALIFLATFILIYFSNLKYLAGTWWVR